MDFWKSQPQGEDVLTLSDLLNRVEELIEECFPSFFWVVAEVAEIQERGHLYLELVEKEGESIKARIRGIIWVGNVHNIMAPFEAVTGQSIKVGMKLLLGGRVRFHPAYHLSFDIQWIDPNYSLGEMARKRREILCRLEEEGLLERNLKLPFPLVPQRIAVVSSERSAGWEDFLAHLRENPYGFSFAITLFPAFVQGEGAERSILEALQDILMEVSRFDVVVLLRGGGSRVDLSCFDSYPLGKMIAGFPLPVLTGIGHYKDRSVVDYVAHSALKTPTAVANFLVDRVKEFDEQLVEQYILLQNLIQEIFEGYGVTLEDWIGRFHSCAAFLFQREREKTLRVEEKFLLFVQSFFEKQSMIQEELERAIQRETWKCVEKEKSTLEREEKALSLLNPLNVLQRGYTLTFVRGKVVKSIEDCLPGEELRTQTVDGSIWSEVKRRDERID